MFFKELDTLTAPSARAFGASCGPSRGERERKWKLGVVLPCLCMLMFSYVQLSSPIYCSPPGSSVYGIFQARILEWVATSYSKGSSQPRDQTCVSWVGRRILHYLAAWEIHALATILIFSVVVLGGMRGKHCCWKHSGFFFFFFQSLFSCNVVILYGNKLWLTHSRDISLKTFRVLICSKEAFTVFEAQIQWENKFSGASCILVQRACLWSPVLISKDIKN